MAWHCFKVKQKVIVLRSKTVSRIKYASHSAHYKEAITIAQPVCYWLLHTVAKPYCTCSEAVRGGIKEVIGSAKAEESKC